MLKYFSVYWLLSSIVHSAVSAAASNDETETKSYEENKFDTYNADECPRVRRPWLSLNDEEKQLYVKAMLKLREMGEGQIDKDELIAVGSEHMDGYGEVAHYASIYLFWHNYLLWEIESRIRNLGGEYRCFAVPYWDFSTEAQVHSGEAPLIFQNDINHLGGMGDPNNAWTVNEYSWPGVTVKDWWIPTHCTAEGDVYPLCSLKRSTNLQAHYMQPEEIGRGIIENADFLEFSKWYSDTFGLPHSMLTDDETLHFPVVTSYDPIWYLFHSMVSYHQGIWQDCHEYDQIAPDDLDEHEHAYSEYCDLNYCGDMSLDAPFVYHGMLSDTNWAFVANDDLTVRKAYHQPRWNVLYDLEDGHGFYRNSGLMDFCKGKLNKKWFILNEGEVDADRASNDEVVLSDEVEQDVTAQRKGKRKGKGSSEDDDDVVVVERKGGKKGRGSSEEDDDVVVERKGRGKKGSSSDEDEMVLNAANDGYVATGIYESSNKLLAVGFVAVVLMVMFAAWCFRAKGKDMDRVLKNRGSVSHSYGAV